MLAVFKFADLPVAGLPLTIAFARALLLPLFAAEVRGLSACVLPLLPLTLAWLPLLLLLLLENKSSQSGLLLAALRTLLWASAGPSARALSCMHTTAPCQLPCVISNPSGVPDIDALHQNATKMQSNQAGRGVIVSGNSRCITGSSHVLLRDCSTL